MHFNSVSVALLAAIAAQVSSAPAPRSLDNEPKNSVAETGDSESLDSVINQPTSLFLGRAPIQAKALAPKPKPKTPSTKPPAPKLPAKKPSTVPTASKVTAKKSAAAPKLPAKKPATRPAAPKVTTKKSAATPAASKAVKQKSSPASTSKKQLTATKPAVASTSGASCSPKNKKKAAKRANEPPKKVAKTGDNQDPAKSKDQNTESSSEGECTDNAPPVVTHFDCEKQPHICVANCWHLFCVDQVSELPIFTKVSEAENGDNRELSGFEKARNLRGNGPCTIKDGKTNPAVERNFSIGEGFTSVEEFPFASSKQGGKGASLRCVPITENRDVQGPKLSDTSRKLNDKDGSQFTIAFSNVKAIKAVDAGKLPDYCNPFLGETTTCVNDGQQFHFENEKFVTDGRSKEWEQSSFPTSE